MKVSRLLEKAKARFQAPENWIKSSDAEDKDGQVVAPSSTKACRWCARGAVRSFRAQPGTVRDAIDLLSFNAPGYSPSILAYNDSDVATFKGILETFDRAIAEAKSRGK